MNVGTSKECCLKSWNTLHSVDNPVNEAVKVKAQYSDRAGYSDIDSWAKPIDIARACSIETSNSQKGHSTFNEEPHWQF